MLNKLKELLIGKAPEGGTAVPASLGLTNQELVDKMVQHFLQRMGQESTDVTLLYPTSFYIYLNEQDYQSRSEAFAFVVNDFVYKFNELIRQRRANYVDYHPHARYWQFQFVEFSEHSQVEGFGEVVTHLEPKDVFILSFLYPKMEGMEDGSENERVVATVHVKDSMQECRLAVNWEALRGVDMRAKDRYVMPMERQQTPSNSPKGEECIAPSERLLPLGEDRGGPGQGGGSSSLPSLKAENCAFLIDGGKHSRYYMTGSELYLSGKNDAEWRAGVPVARLDSEYVMVPNAQIRYNSSKGIYEFLPLADVILNEVPLNQDLDSWTPLPHLSSILLNGEVQLTFYINQA